MIFKDVESVMVGAAVAVTLVGALSVFYEVKKALERNRESRNR